MRYLQRTRFVARAVAVLAAAAGLSACDVMVSTMHGGGKERAERTWTRSYTLDAGGAAVEIVNVNGPINVEAADGNTLDVRVVMAARGATPEDAKKALDQVELAEEAGASRVRLQAKYPRELGRRGIEVSYTIRAPRSARLALETVNGHVQVDGAFAAVQAETTNGAVRGEGLGNTVVATTTNGEIKIRMASMGGEGVALETTNGGIDLKLPAGAKATLSARCVNGGIKVADLPFEKSGEGSRRKLDGAINGGGAAVKLETVNGSIRVGGTT
ncbi:MAG: DUF4097 family beta strand repeat-containing protein [Vicinamibacterales bacterium]|jgi:hypothetical protein|nr:DUF4097 family beta strand repeat-containing protein [Vicinamibacterales bacterium]